MRRERETKKRHWEAGRHSIVVPQEWEQDRSGNVDIRPWTISNLDAAITMCCYCVPTGQSPSIGGKREEMDSGTQHRNRTRKRRRASPGGKERGVAPTCHGGQRFLLSCFLCTQSCRDRSGEASSRPRRGMTAASHLHGVPGLCSPSLRLIKIADCPLIRCCGQSQAA
jgi:hypothetical protein